MAQLKPMMIMGGTLQDTARASSRSSVRGLVEPLATNRFSTLMEEQNRPVSPQGGMQAVRARTLGGLARAMEQASGDPMQDALAAQSLRTMVGALNQDLSSHTPAYAKKSSLDGPIPLARGRDVLPSGTIAQSVRATHGARNASTRQTPDAERLGTLSAKFESGSDGIAAIGYDRVGGTSYGKYQIASKPGSMDKFLQFMDSEAPELATRLRNAGPANTGGRNGDMPGVWRDIAAKQPERFAALQEQFIRDSHYTPALEAVRAAGFNTDEFSPALKEVLWSTSVQHGPVGAAKIFIRAAEQADPAVTKERDLIRGVYANRADQFGSSSENVRAAVRQRLQQEQHLALAMTKGKQAT